MSLLHQAASLPFSSEEATATQAPAFLGDLTSYVTARVAEISHDDEVCPTLRMMGAQALVDDLARALARMLLEAQPVGTHPPSEPSR